MRMRLVKPSKHWRSAFQEMARECHAAGDQRYALAARDVEAHVSKLEAAERAGDLPAGRVPSTEFWLEHDGQIVACARLRFELTPLLAREGGHIGYDVRPSMRRRGYATALLGMVLAEARARGIQRVLVTSDDDNVGSIKVIERNGGRLSGRVAASKTGKTIRQYWFE